MPVSSCFVLFFIYHCQKLLHPQVPIACFWCELVPGGSHAFSRSQPFTNGKHTLVGSIICGLFPLLLFLVFSFSPFFCPNLRQVRFWMFASRNKQPLNPLASRWALRVWRVPRTKCGETVTNSRHAHTHENLPHTHTRATHTRPKAQCVAPRWNHRILGEIRLALKSYESVNK